MACCRCTQFFTRVPGLGGVLTVSRPLTTSASLHGKQKKEPPLEKWGLEKFPEVTKCRPLLELPDYTYLDGRPTPLTKKQLEEKERNYVLAKRIVKLTSEMQAAKEAYAKKMQDTAMERETIINSKLKQKSEEL